MKSIFSKIGLVAIICIVYLSLPSISFAEPLLEKKGDLFEGEKELKVTAVEKGRALPVYIRLDNIHPGTNSDELTHMIKTLNDKEIPYILSLVPVYLDEVKNEELRFSDSPKLIRVLKTAQRTGGSIVLQGNLEEIKQTTTNRSEKVRNELTSTIEEFANYGLKPIALDVPDYMNSKIGYRVIGESFSTIVQFQRLVEEIYPVSEGIRMLGEMKVLDPSQVRKTMDGEENDAIKQDGTLTAFFDAHLGVDLFNGWLDEVEMLPNVTWVDLKKRKMWVKTDHVSITTEESKGAVKMKRSGLLFSSIDYPIYHLVNIIGIVVWGMAIVGFIAVLLFIGGTFFISHRRGQLTIGNKESVGVE